MLADGDCVRGQVVNVDLFGDTATVKRAMGSHESHSGGTDEWLTPPELIEALGSFDLDPCAPIVRPWPTATDHFTIEDDGLRLPWNGRVWLNPPYASTGPWMRRMAEHGSGIALLFARTETLIWQDHIWPHAHAFLFLRGRLAFHYSDGRRASANAGAPSVLISYSEADTQALKESGLDGALVMAVTK